MYLLRPLVDAGVASDGNGARSWERVPVPPEGVALVRVREETGAAERVHVAIVPGRAPDAAAHLVPFEENQRPSAALVLAPSAESLFVDGVAPLRVCVLGERSEIALARTRFYFTARRPLAVTRHTGGAADCALCGESVEGAQVIACTGCGAVTHEGALAGGEERRCFSHHGRCPRCHVSRDDFAWIPEQGV